jgi:hypothetical protein
MEHRVYAVRLLTEYRKAVQENDSTRISLLTTLLVDDLHRGYAALDRERDIRASFLISGVTT